ncbi:MAG: tetratricopeptide repeat protein [Flavobacteriales bacterium]|nr:tetratricopeptide repeat protein [Flavobacteriales bacterium]
MAKKQAQDETIVDVQEIYTKTEMYVDRNRKTLTIVLVGVALVALAFFGYKYFVVQPKVEKAQSSIWRAEMYFMNDSLDQALNGDDEHMGFLEVAKAYDGTSVGMLANYYLGIIYRDQGDYQSALDHFSKSDFDDDVLGLIAMGNVGDMYVELGDLNQGAEWLNKAARKASASDSKSYSAPLYLLKAAMVQLELGNNAEAKKMFDEITTNYPDATEYEKAAKYGAMLYQY